MTETIYGGTLLYDGECAVCRRWIEYYRQLTRERVHYLPYQDNYAQFAPLTAEDCRQSIQYISSDGTVRASGAGAAFATLASVPSKQYWWRWYCAVSFFRYLSEKVYRFCANHRSLLALVTTACWGHSITPARYELVSDLFIRLLGVVYICAFASFAVQAMGLIGENGIVPLQAWLDGVYQRLGALAYYHAPNVFWLSASDAFITALCWGGVLCGVLLSVLPLRMAQLNIVRRLVLLVAFIFYLSLFYAGQVFMSYQWDLLLLECGLLAIFLSPRSALPIWLFRLLLFRFMFLSGVVKLLSGDATWADWSALQFHYETQPLPTPLAWYAHHLPATLHYWMVGATFVVELVLPWLIFFPRRLRHIAAIGFVVLEIAILCTGNYNYFNVLTIFLCLFLLDDQWLTRFYSVRSSAQFFSSGWCLRIFFVTVTLLGMVRIAETFYRAPVPLLSYATDFFSPLHAVNRYGLFAIMTTERNEIIIEGSWDGQQWHAYSFRYKPDATHRPPPWNIPHQPRLDWQLWFASLRGANNAPWFSHLMLRLLQGSPSVNALFASNPFASRPPVYVRAHLYRYRYTRWHNQSGDWWQREKIADYFPAVRLASDK